MERSERNLPARSPEQEKRRAEYEALVKEYTDLIEYYRGMIDHEGPHLSALYMHHFGQLLYEQLKRTLAVDALRMRRSLLQAYVNRDQAPDLEEINSQMEARQREYDELLAKRMSDIKEAKRYLSSPGLTVKETNELRALYKTLVKRLHPDLHPQYSEAEKKLFLATVKAYQQGDLAQMRALMDLLNKDDLMQKKLQWDADTLESEIDKLRKRMIALDEKRILLESGFPFIHRALLHDAERIKVKKETIEQAISELKAEEDKLKVIVSLLEEYKSRNLRYE